ncbi:MAG: molybdopterin converting factor subunit 1 [Pseudomonadota bacterium]
MKIDVRYFAWVRERIGVGHESVETDAATPRALIEELRTREARYEAAFQDITALRVAVDQELVDMDDALGTAREVAFFPPMTGG